MSIKVANRAIDLLGGNAVAAEVLNPLRPEGSPKLTPAAVSMWRKRGIPVDYCIPVEKALNGDIRCEEMRSSHDWEYLRSTKTKKSKAA